MVCVCVCVCVRCVILWVCDGVCMRVLIVLVFDGVDVWSLASSQATFSIFKVRRGKITARYTLQPLCTGPFSPLPILVLKKKWPGDDASESLGVEVWGVKHKSMYMCTHRSAVCSLV